MGLGFFRHGATAALTFVVAGLVTAWGVGAVALWGPEIVLAILFYLSEYGMHRFAFHAPRRRALRSSEACSTACTMIITSSRPARPALLPLWFWRRTSR